MIAPLRRKHMEYEQCKVGKDVLMMIGSIKPEQIGNYVLYNCTKYLEHSLNHYGIRFKIT